MRASAIGKFGAVTSKKWGGRPTALCDEADGHRTAPAPLTPAGSQLRSPGGASLLPTGGFTAGRHPKPPGMGFLFLQNRQILIGLFARNDVI